MTSETLALIAPLAGRVVPLAEVPDPMFALGMMGDGLAIEPAAGIVYAPCAATVVSVHRRGHAVKLKAATGAEILIHVGLEAVALRGEGFLPAVKEGDTVFDVLSYVCDKYKIHMSYRGGTSSGCYVDGINNLYEFDGGRWSGWMYCVNDWYPNYGCGVYYVKPGEVIEWNYTCDLGLDLDSSWWEGAQDWKDNHD